MLRVILTATMVTTIVPMAAAASPPTVSALGYAREVLHGIPAMQGSGNVASGRNTVGLPAEYFLYVEVAPESHISVKWAAVRGEYYAASLDRVSTPVRIDADAAVPTGKKETLVPKTKNDVYRVVLGDKLTNAPVDDEAVTLVAQNDAVVCVTVKDAPAYAVVKALRALKPRAGM